MKPVNSFQKCADCPSMTKTCYGDYVCSMPPPNEDWEILDISTRKVHPETKPEWCPKDKSNEDARAKEDKIGIQETLHRLNYCLSPQHCEKCIFHQSCYTDGPVFISLPLSLIIDMRELLKECQKNKECWARKYEELQNQLVKIEKETNFVRNLIGGMEKDEKNEDI